MRIKMLVAIASSEDWAYAPGQVLEVGREISQEVAAAWLSNGHAEPVRESLESAEVAEGAEAVVAPRRKKRASPPDEGG